MGIASAGERMSHDGRAIANFVLDMCESEGIPQTNLSLQKIVYFCHAWTLTLLDKPLVKHKFEAWQFGPVLQYLYRDFKDFDREKISSRAMKLDPLTGERVVVKYNLEKETEDLLRKVVGFYAKRRAGTLVEMSHVEGGPWHAVWNHEGKIRPGMAIEDEDIRSYYSKRQVPF